MTVAVRQTFAPDVPQETALSNSFALLLAVLADYVSAEHDLEHIGFSLDPAYANWNTQAERAQDRLIDVLHALLGMPLEIPEDRPLRRIAMGLHTMRISDLNKARVVHAQMDACFDRRFLQPATSATARHRNLLALWSQPILASFAALSFFDDEGEDTPSEEDVPAFQTIPA